MLSDYIYLPKYGYTNSNVFRGNEMTSLNVAATVTGTKLTLDLANVSNSLNWTLNATPKASNTNINVVSSNTGTVLSFDIGAIANTLGWQLNTVPVIANTTNTSNVTVTNKPNIVGIVTDGTAFTGGGYDGDGEALSATLLGTTKTWSNTIFAFGTPNVNNCFSSTTINFVPSTASAIKVLGSAVNGNQPSQSFVITYTDNTTSSVTQSISDWATPQSYSGESEAVSMSYRLASSGAQSPGTFYLYGYSFPVTAGKSVKSLTLPTNRSVVIAAAVLVSSNGSTNSNTSNSTSNTANTSGNTSSNTSNVSSNTSNTVTSNTVVTPTGNYVVNVASVTLNGSILSFTGSGFSAVTGVALVGASNLTYTKTGDTGLNVNISSATVSAGAGTVAISTNMGTTNVWFSTNAYDYLPVGNDFLLNTDNFAGNPGQLFWGIDQTTWGYTDTQSTERYGIGAAPGVSMGWSQNQVAFEALGGTAMAVNRGMGKSVTALQSANVTWTLSGPLYPNGRWDALCDNYFHQHNNPEYSEFYPFLDLMVTQMISDQLNTNGTTYYQTVCQQNNARRVKIGGNGYTVFIDSPDFVFNQSGGHTIWMALEPNAFSANVNPANPIWGSPSATHDMASIIKFWMQSSPKDINGNVIVNAAGTPITSPLITSDLYWNECYCGIEVDFGTSFKTSYWNAVVQ